MKSKIRKIGAILFIFLSLTVFSVQGIDTVEGDMTWGNTITKGLTIEWDWTVSRYGAEDSVIYKMEVIREPTATTRPRVKVWINDDLYQENWTVVTYIVPLTIEGEYSSFSELEVLMKEEDDELVKVVYNDQGILLEREEQEKYGNVTTHLRSTDEGSIIPAFDKNSVLFLALLGLIVIVQRRKYRNG